MSFYFIIFQRPAALRQEDVIVCSNQTCRSVYEERDVCEIIVNNGTDNCNVPCFENGCKSVTRYNVECLIWLCEPLVPTTTTTPPSPPSQSLCTDTFCLTSVSLNVLAVVAIGGIGFAYLRRRNQLRRWLASDDRLVSSSPSETQTQPTGTARRKSNYNRCFSCFAILFLDFEVLM